LEWERDVVAAFLAAKPALAEVHSMIDVAWRAHPAQRHPGARGVYAQRNWLAHPSMARLTRDLEKLGFATRGDPPKIHPQEEHTEWIWDMTERIAWRPEVTVIGQSGSDPGVEVDAWESKRRLAVMIEWDSSRNGRLRLATVETFALVIQYLLVVTRRFEDVVRELEEVLRAPGMAEEVRRPTVALEAIGILEC
jgi:hypothetical protein